MRKRICLVMAPFKILARYSFLNLIYTVYAEMFICSLKYITSTATEKLCIRKHYNIVLKSFAL